jgi:hypothetical protein
MVRYTLIILIVILIVIREEMEDDHDVRLKFSKKPNCGFFGIFDGHSGSDAASWVAKNLSHLFIEELEEYNQDTISVFTIYFFFFFFFILFLIYFLFSCLHLLGSNAKSRSSFS